MNAEESQEIAEEGTRLFVGGLSSEVDDSKLREAFQQFGRLRDGRKRISYMCFLTSITIVSCFSSEHVCANRF